MAPRFPLRHQDCFSQAAMEPCPRPGGVSEVSAQLTGSRSVSPTGWGCLVRPRRPPFCTVRRRAAAWWPGCFFHSGMLDIVSPKLMPPICQADETWPAVQAAPPVVLLEGPTKPSVFPGESPGGGGGSRTRIGSARQSSRNGSWEDCGCRQEQTEAWLHRGRASCPGLAVTRLSLSGHSPLPYF